MKTLPYGVMIILNNNHVLTIYVYLVLHEEYLIESSQWSHEGIFSKCILQTRKSRLKDIRYLVQGSIDEIADYRLTLVLMTPNPVLFSLQSENLTCPRNRV